MPRKKNPSNNYFHEGVEEAIQLYNKSESQLERNRLFTIIYPALTKISEVYYNKIKPSYIDDEPINIQMDCTSYLTERLFRIKAGKGKAFSYFTICAKNFYIFQNQKAYKEVQKTLKLDVLNQNWDIEDVDTGRAEQMETSAKLLSAFVDYMDEHKEKFVRTKKGKVVVTAVVDFLRDVDSIEDFNRRNIMNDLTEINGYKVDRHYVTKVFNKLQMHYNVFSREWLKTGKSIPFWDKEELTPNEIQYCIENYSQANKKLGVIALARQFKVPEYSVRKELAKVGLCKI